MNNPCLALFILLLATASSLTSSSMLKACRATIAPNVYLLTRMVSGNAANGDILLVATSTQSAWPQSPSQSQTASVVKPSQPSPFVVAAFIVGLVAVFGALFSLYGGRRRGKQVRRGAVVERFWVIDSSDLG